MKRILTFFVFVLGAVLLLDSCTKEFSFEQGGGLTLAKGSLTDSLGNCLYDSVHGTFYNGVTPGADTAFVEIQVNVDTAGSYSIYTDLENGIMFGDSGYFNTTGINTIRLKPIGTPILQTITHFTISFDSSFCGFDLNVHDSTGTGLGNGGGDTTSFSNDSDTAWSFTVDSNLQLNGPFDSAYIGVNDSGTVYLALYGSTAATGDSLLRIAVLLPTGTLSTGTYTTESGSIMLFAHAQDTAFIYYADSTTSGVNTTITITSYDQVSNLVTGTFTGTVYDLNGDIINITNGKFKAKLE